MINLGTSMSSSLKEMSPKAKDVQGFLRKPRKVIALGLFVLMLARAFWVWRAEDMMFDDLLAAYDIGHDNRLTSAEMVSLLSANGVDLTQDQVNKIFGRLDDEGDGFDEDEMEQVVNMVSDMPNASERLRKVARASSTLYFDIFLSIATGLGLMYIVGQSDAIEKKWAASTFKSAVTFRRMQNKCSKLDDQLETLCKERKKLETEIKRVEESTSGDIEERNEELKRLGSALQEVQTKQDTAKKELEGEVQRWQLEAEKCMREASLAKSKMERVMKCVKGLDSFTGAGTGSFTDGGAQQGFSHVQSSRGFSRDVITFGTIEKGQLQMYETAYSKKLGEGKDCAYRCTNLSTGDELALKMYKISNPAQRHAIHNDLNAYRSQVGQHPSIVSYERVIESESTIFVLMELLSGQDLFDVIAQRGLTEPEAAGLFKQLADALSHLHKNGVIHCDVKPENAMVIGDIGQRSAHLKLIDFGCSCFSDSSTGAKGSIVLDAYMPPEHAENHTLKPSVATDMWRLGCTLYVMLVRRPPFFADADKEYGVKARKEGKFFRPPDYDTLSSEAKDLIEKLMLGDAAKRFTTEQVLDHPWVTKHASRQKLEKAQSA